jgi:peptide/nickel transport system ATP-binding protein/oligopeptide transport system ATP-binding protein
MAEPLLILKGLKKHFRGFTGLFGRSGPRIRALDGVSFQVYPGETFGLVGESGCGKSTLGKTILGIYRPMAGSVVFKGQDITHLSKKASMRLRSEIQYVYQDPGSSLDPRWKVRRILAEPLVIHTTLNRKTIQERVDKIVEAVGLKREQLSLYPHEFSGGQQRRLGLARILCLNPTLVILDEPTSGLDVSVQATILKLFMELKRHFDLTYMFISHNLSVVQMMCQRLAVMYAGKIVEMGKTADIFDSPIHPYTKTLLAAIPVIGKKQESDFSLNGEPPDPSNFPPGCRFWPRCSYRMDICQSVEPEISYVDQDRTVSCHLLQQG